MYSVLMLFDVPFLPDNEYAAFLEAHGQFLHSVHYSLAQPHIPDGRHKSEVFHLAQLNEALSRLRGVKKYALLNSRFHSPLTYLNQTDISRILHVLEQLLIEDNIDGIVVVDFYLLQSLSDAGPAVAAELEAVPGINCMLDSMERIRSCLNIIAGTNFAFPGKLNLDRSLNRNLPVLAEISAACREIYPGMQLTLLANEGCLLRCPFKFSHDSHIALANLDNSCNLTFEINRNLGCIRVLSDFPEEILRSPFIRPEDQELYAQYADVLKICGRTLGPVFLKKVITAYLEGQYRGNLLGLLDTQDWQVDRLILANQDFPGDFLQHITSCNNDCGKCSYCKEVFERVSRFQPLALKDFRSPEPAE